MTNSGPASWPCNDDPREATPRVTRPSGGCVWSASVVTGEALKERKYGGYGTGGVSAARGWGGGEVFFKYAGWEVHGP